MKSGSVEAYLNFDELELYIIPYCESPLSSGRISLSLLHSTCVEQALRLIERSSPLGELHLGRSGVIGLWHCSLRETLCFIADCANIRSQALRSDPSNILRNLSLSRRLAETKIRAVNSQTGVQVDTASHLPRVGKST